ncbi:hypothetical protein [Lacipirellula sp.]
MPLDECEAEPTGSDFHPTEDPAELLAAENVQREAAEAGESPLDRSK